MKKIRMKDVAAVCGVSTQHVSRVLRGEARIAVETRKKVLQTAAEMGYLKQNRFNRIAVLSPGCLDDWNDLCLETLEKYGMEGVLFPFRQFTVNEECFFDAAIYLNGVDQAGRIWPKKFHIPLLVINQYGNAAEKISSVLPDADDEMFRAVQHLAELGHKRIARLHPTDFSGTKQNVTRGENAFLEAASYFHIQEFVYTKNYEPAWRIKQVIPHLLKRGFTAFIVVADPNHQRVLDIFKNEGKSIPRDVSLIVYEITLPPELELTSIEINNRLTVETGVQQILKKIDGFEIPEQTTIPSILHVRKSTGMAPL